MSGRSIRARGIVQGVGFRPTIWRLAQQYKLTGSVWNDHQGVMIHVFGSVENIEAFIRQIPLQLPPLARLESLEVQPLNQTQDDAEFRIVESSQIGKAQTPIAADAATCPDCIADIINPQNRRYRYPFTNCTHCGPRLSIVHRIPYDRCNTSMAEFAMCPQCLHEYEDPADRRFHAQANCCPDCGPKLWLEDKTGQRLECDDPIEKTAELIRQGHIVAIKGLGGFHLACDASDSNAVRLLRERKQRYAKPFALMAKDIAMIGSYARLSEAEKTALLEKTAPIVLLEAHGKSLASGIAPEDDKLGFMLPYTPLYTLLLQELEAPIVLTSGNLSDEPQCIQNEEARIKLAEIADYCLMHDRAIVNRLDDSVMREMAGQMRLLRRARGYSPEALKLPEGFEPASAILAMGAELKNSFCLIKQGQAIVSQHMGDLENASVQKDYRHAIALYKQLYEFEPECIAVDLHPGYLSTQYGHALTDTGHCVSVQHHHAHLAACLAEHGIGLNAPPVLAALFDGLGLGDDGTLWGGEFILGDYRSYTRLSHFQPIPLPGSNQAMREPWRNAYAQLNHYFDWQALQKDYAELEIMVFLQNKPLATLENMIAKNINSPLSTSCGRWFDAFAAALGLNAECVQYEGQAAIAVENLAKQRFAKEQPYPQAYSIDDSTILSWQGLWQAVLDDLKQGIDKARIAARIHHSLIEATVECLNKLSQQNDTQTIVLSGGVFQNKLLLEGVSERLQNMGKTVLSPRLYPINDGGLALGQAAIAAAQIIESKNGYRSTKNTKVTK